MESTPDCEVDSASYLGGPEVRAVSFALGLFDPFGRVVACCIPSFFLVRHATASHGLRTATNRAMANRAAPLTTPIAIRHWNRRRSTLARPLGSRKSPKRIPVALSLYG